MPSAFGLGFEPAMREFTAATVTGMTRAMQASPPLESNTSSAGEPGLESSGPAIDRFLAATLRRERIAWPACLTSGGCGAAVLQRIGYHGIAGLLNDRAGDLRDWPDDVMAQIRTRALGHAMWEMRHRIVLARLVGAFSQAGVRCLFLKGTGLAYDRYPNPATRIRGDSDVLVDRNELERARAVLANLGFVGDANVAGLSDDIHLQEIWRFDHVDQTRHDIDVHWQVMNSFALSTILDVESCFARAVPLPRLAPKALTLDRVSMMIHTALHKATHIVSPYFADGLAYFGGDRLIWAYDVHLLAQAFSAEDWTRLVQAARKDGTAEVCLAALTFARDRLATDVPTEVIAELNDAIPDDRQSDFLLRSGQLDRAWRDLRAVVGWRSKVAFFARRLFPPPAFVRAKYPDLIRRPLPALYLRRIVGLFRDRLRDGPP